MPCWVTARRNERRFARQERQANEWAARLLISPGAYAEAESIRGPHPPSLAFEIGVTIELIHAFQRLLRQGGHGIRRGRTALAGPHRPG